MSIWVIILVAVAGIACLIFWRLIPESEPTEEEKWVDMIVNSGLLQWDTKDRGSSWQNHTCQDAEMSVVMSANNYLGGMKICIDGVCVEIEEEYQARRLKKYINHCLRVSAQEKITNRLIESVDIESNHQQMR